MGFLRRVERIEIWLTNASTGFRALSQREYSALVSGWRERFEIALETGRYVVRGAQAEREMASSDCSHLFVFSMPGYRLLPSRTDGAFDVAYGYSVTNLQQVDWQTANATNAILADSAFTFTCLCTHESGIMTQVQFLIA